MIKLDGGSTFGVFASQVQSAAISSQGRTMESQEAGLSINGFGQVFSEVYLHLQHLWPMSTCPGDGQIDLITPRIRAYLSREFHQASHGIEKFLCRVWRYERQKQDVAFQKSKKTIPTNDKG